MNETGKGDEDKCGRCKRHLEHALRGFGKGGKGSKASRTMADCKAFELDMNGAYGSCKKCGEKKFVHSEAALGGGGRRRASSGRKAAGGGIGSGGKEGKGRSSP
jgi:DNA-directed RNA polymerase subunit RPC12/RpoP